MAEVASELRDGAGARARPRASPREQVIVDPGIGFAKDAAHSLEVLRAAARAASLDRPLLVGPSRKSFIGKVLDLPAGERLHGHRGRGGRLRARRRARGARPRRRGRWSRSRASATRSRRTRLAA